MVFYSRFKIINFCDSVGSLGGSTVGSASRPGSVRAKKTKSWLIPDSLNKLYELLIAPFEDFLFAPCGKYFKLKDIISYIELYYLY